MLRRSLLLLVSAGMASAAAFADPEACLSCHDANEFEGREPAAVLDDLADPGIPPHGRFAEMTLEEVKALLEALAE
jgi:hypothetical protein